MERVRKALGLYIHIPFCQSKCHYCDFPSFAGMEHCWDAYIEAVLKELAYKAELFASADIKTIFIGGGTPSLLPYPHIVKLMETVHARYNVLPLGEATIESNPGTLSDEKLKAYKSVGLNRLSLGLQACQDHLLKKLGRIHTREDFLTAVKLAKKNGFHNLNADLIFGIPGQSLKDWQETVSWVTDLCLTHISCYSLKIEEDTVFGSMKSMGTLHEMDDELDREMYHLAVRDLARAGFDHYEISNFAKPHDLCQHNMNYWECGEYIGIGAGAHSFYENRRYANTSNVTAYMEGIRSNAPLLAEDYTLNKEERLSERMVLGLRLNRGIDLHELSTEFGVDLEERYREKIERLLSWKLVEHCGTVLKLTKRGMDLANAVFVEFI